MISGIQKIISRPSMNQQRFLMKEIKSAKNLDQIFNDKQYLERCEFIMSQYDHKNGKLKVIDYSICEQQSWKSVFQSYRQIIQNHACEEIQNAFYTLNQKLSFQEDQIPQLAKISEIFNELNGWKIRPVPGLISDQDYLEALSNKVYCSTQIIRRPQDVEFSPYPDYIHDLLGHIIPIANRDISNKLNKIGCLSVNVDNEQLEQIAFIYWKVFEMGFMKDKKGQYKALGGAVLSSHRELMNIYNQEVSIKHIRDFQMVKKNVQDESLQKEYYYIDSLDDIDEVLENLQQSWSSNKNNSAIADFHFQFDHSDQNKMQKLTL
ncbi:pyridoxal-dependent decarboxylase [Stylonychia lemnae]|uniref:phenylalanine 4-monooxygenase n=1 Tax=Stylonychia lemnae TaxID=5949 RepID=A0A078A1D2_STYLE|nr:pyridoxal-dependent decarboxylase [Stylonychia lemnae]|eukprot:CDW75652.1 pyridoxal-dependent decarboxylase [Stylonychia lemnae]